VDVADDRRVSKAIIGADLDWPRSVVDTHLPFDSEGRLIPEDQSDIRFILGILHNVPLINLLPVLIFESGVLFEDKPVYWSVFDLTFRDENQLSSLVLKTHPISAFDSLAHQFIFAVPRPELNWSHNSFKHV